MIRDSMLETFGALATHASLHTSDPGTTGHGEGEAGRVRLLWLKAKDGTKTSKPAVFDVPPGDYTHFGLWDAAGQWCDGGPLQEPEQFNGQGKYTLTVTVAQD